MRTTVSWAASKKPPVPPAGSQIVSLGCGLLSHRQVLRGMRDAEEVLACAAVASSVSFAEPSVSVAFTYGVERRPCYLVDQVSDQAAQLAGVLDLVLAAHAKDNADQSWFFAGALPAYVDNGISSSSTVSL